MKKYLVLSINGVVLVGLILYSVYVDNRAANLKHEYEAAYSEFKELDRRYFPKLESINIEIEKNLNESAFKQLPDSIELKMINRNRLGSYFYDYKQNTDWVFALVKVGLEEQLIAIRVFTLLSALLLLLNCSYIFFERRRKQ